MGHTPEAIGLEQEPVPSVEQRIRALRDGLAEAVDQLGAIWPDVEEELLDTDSSGKHGLTRDELRRVAAQGDRVTARVRALIGKVDRLEDDWAASRRFNADVIDDRLARLASTFEAEPVLGASQWLRELIEALAANEQSAATRIADFGSEFPAGLQEEATLVRGALSRWLEEGAYEPGLELLRRISDDALHGFEINHDVRARACRFAAWLHLARAGDADEARQQLDRAIELAPNSAQARGDRAAYFLVQQELDAAELDAHMAIDLAPDEGIGYRWLGAWAEASAETDEACDLYRQAAERMSTYELGRLPTAPALREVSGAMLVAAAEQLLSRQRFDVALMIADHAVQVGVSDLAGYANAHPHRLRSLALERLPSCEAEAASAAMDAARLSLLDGDLDAAIDLIQRGWGLDENVQEAGWLLADALVGKSCGLGHAELDVALLEQARTHWENWTAKIGPPSGESSWAYLTRASVAELSATRPDADRAAELWDALGYAERALLHDATDGARWAFVAEYLIELGLERLALEAVERAYRHDPDNQRVLTARITLLSNLGRFEEAEDSASELEAAYGPDAWVSGVRGWLALRRDAIEEALEFLDPPLAHDEHFGWLYDLRATCHLACGDVPSARDDYRRAIAKTVPRDGSTKCQMATASVGIGDLAGAEQWLAAAEKDATTDTVTYAGTRAYLELARDDIDAAATDLSGAVAGSANVRELDDVVRVLEIRLGCLEGSVEQAEARREAVERVRDKVVPERRAALEAHPASGDSELAAERDHHDDGASGSSVDAVLMTLLAVSGRRLALAGRYVEAAGEYQRLRESKYEPEASIALSRTLWAASEERERSGDVAAVPDLQHRLHGLGETDELESVLSVARALESAGRLREARESLAGYAGSLRDDVQRARLQERLGALAMADRDFEAALTAFQEAFEAASRRDDRDRVAQLQLRMGLLALLRGDRAEAMTKMSSAVIAWRSAGAFEPSKALVEELRGLARGLAGPVLAPLVVDALRATIERLSTETHAGAREDLDQLESEVESREAGSPDPSSSAARGPSARQL